MNPSLFPPVMLALGLAVVAPAPLLSQSHSHLNAGALAARQNAPLLFANAADFAPASYYVKTLIQTNAGKYAGYYQGSITLTALPQTAAHAGPDPQASAPGSFIQASIVSVSGPAGGEFAFWENGAAKPTFSLQTGQTGTNLWRLSENDGSSGSDPYGHIHGRRFTATLPGVYTIGFQAFDTSTNGAGGGPIHTPSDIALIRFQAGVNMDFIEPDYEEGHVHVRFGAMEGFLWQLEATPAMSANPLWSPAGEPVVGADVFIEVIHDVPPGNRRFYRVRGTPIDP
ncbi:MAG: hypothetical protein HYR88_06300 [Verrucomicrobia bacterium]|nr:hypothetical protein [Verrucomicrobiota bacterium]MBI3868574.1 hypothetical protein [Verrucomicrobiota bacterium]